MVFNGEVIKKIRKDKKLTQGELATKANISRTYLSDVENNRYNPSLETLGDIARALEVDIKELVKSSLGEELAPVRLGPNFNEKIITINVLGQIAAGIPIEAIEDILDTEEIVIPLSDDPGEYFGLKVKGDSMAPKIFDGDIVICKKQCAVESNEVAVVLVNGDDATLKRVKRFEAGISLIPDNPAFSPMFYSNEEIESLPIAILGKVVELRRII